jgi:hypothetical protein
MAANVVLERQLLSSLDCHGSRRERHSQSIRELGTVSVNYIHIAIFLAVIRMFCPHKRHT